MLKWQAPQKNLILTKRKIWSILEAQILNGTQTYMEHLMPNGNVKCSKKWEKMRKTNMTTTSMKSTNFEYVLWLCRLFCKYLKVHKVTELMMMARRAMSKLNFPRFVSLYPKRILVWGSVSLRVASDKAREIQFGHSPSCHHHQFCHFMNFSTKLAWSESKLNITNFFIFRFDKPCSSWAGLEVGGGLFLISSNFFKWSSGGGRT